MRNIIPGASLPGHETSIQGLNRFFPGQFPRCYFQTLGDKTFKILPLLYNTGVSLQRHIFEVGEKAFNLNLNEIWTVDLTTTTINMGTKTGGLLDGIALGNNLLYLIWGFLDEAFNFAGFGCTRKPYSAFTAVSSGSKGSLATYTITNAFQFTIGSRVVVRNQTGTTPQFQWNWGTVNSIISNTSIKIDMDNNANYGVNILGVVSGEIIQWDSFRPYIVTTTTQTYYQPYYTLLGECYTDATTGNVNHCWRADDPERPVIPAGTAQAIVDTNTTVTSALFDCGRYIPLWADKAGFRAFTDGNGIGQRGLMTDAAGQWWMISRILNKIGRTHI